MTSAPGISLRKADLMSGTAIDLTSLNAQIADANAFGGSTYTITLTADISYASAIAQIALTGNDTTLIIDGAGHTLDATAPVGVFVVNSEFSVRNVTLENLTIENAVAQCGARGGGGGGGGGGAILATIGDGDDAAFIGCPAAPPRAARCSRPAL